MGRRALGGSRAGRAGPARVVDRGPGRAVGRVQGHDLEGRALCRVPDGRPARSPLRRVEHDDVGAARPGGGRGGPQGRLTRRDDQPLWRDPETGYRRRAISPPKAAVEIIEVELPRGREVAYPADSYTFIQQQIWVLDGILTFTEGAVEHVLAWGRLPAARGRRRAVRLREPVARDLSLRRGDHEALSRRVRGASHEVRPGPAEPAPFPRCGHLPLRASIDL